MAPPNTRPATGGPAHQAPGTAGHFQLPGGGNKAATEEQSVLGATHDTPIIPCPQPFYSEGMATILGRLTPVAVPVQCLAIQCVRSLDFRVD